MEIEPEIVHVVDEAAGERIVTEYKAGAGGEPRKVRTMVVRISGDPSTPETPTEPPG